MSDQCDKIRNKVAQLEEKIADLKDQINGATGAELHGLAGQLSQALRQLAQAQNALVECEKTLPPPPSEPPPPPSEPPPPPSEPPPPPSEPPPPDKCVEIRNKVAQLEEKIADLKDQINGATGAELHGLAGQLSQALRQLAQAQEALAACEGKLPPPVPPKPITIGVDRIVCIQETDEPGSDEPYVLVLAVDLASTLKGLPIPFPFPTLHVTRVGPWEGVDDGETHSTAELNQSDRRPFWNLTRKLQLTDPSKTIFLVALMENDGANPESVRTVLEGILTATLFSNLTLDREAMAQALTGAMDAGIDTARASGVGFPFNFDNQIGRTQELNISVVDIDRASRNGSTERNLSFSDEDEDAFYQVFFTISTSPLS